MRRTSLMLAVTVVAFAGPAVAQSLIAPLGQAVRIPIRGIASDVVVGDSAIADVTVVGPGALFVSGRGYGSTNVVVMDTGGRTLFNGRVMVPRSTAGEVTVFRGRAQSAVFCAPLCDPLTDEDGRGAVGRSAGQSSATSGGSAGDADPAPAPTAPPLAPSAPN